jgi:hypothetical protein
MSDAGITNFEFITTPVIKQEHLIMNKILNKEELL